MDKKALRKTMIQKRLLLDQSQFLYKSQVIHHKLEMLDEFKQAKSMGIYLSYKNEVDTFKIIEKYDDQKEIYVPKIEGKTMNFVSFEGMDKLDKNRYGILEPTTCQINNHPDILIVPLVAYDINCNRLGYGGGFYDRFLKDYQGTTIGIAFDFQKVDLLEVEDHDLPLDMIISD